MPETQEIQEKQTIIRHPNKGLEISRKYTDSSLKKRGKNPIYEKRKHIRGSLHTYTSYNFVDKDPCIDEIRTAVQSSNKTMTQIAIGSGVSRHTLKGWFEGKTKRPQFATLEAVARSIGYSFTLTRRE